MKSGYISIIGKPNSGKSTLLNNILGERLAIVTHKAQTTRHKIVGIHNLPCAQMIFLDTPGYHSSEKPLNQFMMEQVESAIYDADVVCAVIDLNDIKKVSEKDEQEYLQKCLMLPDNVQSKKLTPDNTIIVLNKVDSILDSWELVANKYKEVFKDYNIAVVSGQTGHGVESLVQLIAEKLPEGQPFYPDDIYTEHPVRFIVSEIIREQVLLQMHEEVPYSVAIEIEQYKEEPKIHRIHASIIVEKDSQKAMVIGKAGTKIKKIGELARTKIQDLVGSKVFLKLFVRVEKNWTKDPNSIKEFF